MLRILHTADWHLGQTFFGYDRSLEHLHFLSWLKVQLKEKQVDVLLISGDLFDVSNPSSVSQSLFYQFLNVATAENPTLQIVVIAGNHDSASRLEVPQPLLNEEKVVIKGLIPRTREGEIDYDSLIIDLKNKKGKVEALCLAVPFLRQGDYPIVPGASNSYASGVESFYKSIIKRGKTKKEKDQALIAMGHLHIINAVHKTKDHSERIIIGGLERVNPDVFINNLAYTALGHIHKAQRVNKTESIRYSGTPLPMSFAEKEYTHGVVEVVIDKGKMIKIEEVSYQPLVNLISIPEKGSLSPSEVLSKLWTLPDVIEGDHSDEYPYLEINVLLSEPSPLLKNKIEEIIEKKAVRLSRIQSHFYDKKEDMNKIEGSLIGLEEKRPIDVANLYYQTIYNIEMPQELQELFHEVCLFIETKKEDK